MAGVEPVRAGRILAPGLATCRNHGHRQLAGHQPQYRGTQQRRAVNAVFSARNHDRLDLPSPGRHHDQLRATHASRSGRRRRCAVRSASSTATNQAGGGGGGCGQSIQILYVPTGNVATMNIQIGTSSGAGGNGGSAGGNPGIGGSAGAQTTVTINGVTYVALGGKGGNFMLPTRPRSSAAASVTASSPATPSPRILQVWAAL